MHHWSFILAAYGVGTVATVALSLWSYRAMRAAEARADAITRR